jgi:hypothetical protein
MTTRPSLADWTRKRGMDRVEPVRYSDIPCRGPRAHSEDDEAMWLIEWRDLHVRNHPLLDLLFAIPNGGKRDPREAARLKRMGVKAGVVDYFLPVPMVSRRGTECGLWIELKTLDGRVSNEQACWGKLMLEQGYAFKVAHGWIGAARAICAYLGIENIAP